MRPLASLGSALLDLLLCPTAAASSPTSGSPAAGTRAPGGELESGGETHEEASGAGALALGSAAGAAGDTELLPEAGTGAASAAGRVGLVDANGESDDLGGESRSCMPLSM